MLLILTLLLSNLTKIVNYFCITKITKNFIVRNMKFFCKINF